MVLISTCYLLVWLSTPVCSRTPAGLVVLLRGSWGSCFKCSGACPWSWCATTRIASQQSWFWTIIMDVSILFFSSALFIYQYLSLTAYEKKKYKMLSQPFFWVFSSVPGDKCFQTEREIMPFRKCRGFEILFHTFHLATGAKWKTDKIIGWPGTTLAQVLKVGDSQLAFAFTKQCLLSPSPLLVSEVQHFTYQEMSDAAIVVHFPWLIVLLCE